MYGLFKHFPDPSRYPLYTIFLPYYLTAHRAQISGDDYTTYRDWTISSIGGTFGPFLSLYLISKKWFKSRKTTFLAFSMYELICREVA